MIRFEKVSKEYPGKDFSLDAVDITIEKGEFVTLIGTSGSGKTTLLRLLSSEEKPNSGEVYFNDVNIHNLRKKDVPRYRQNIGVVFQDYKLLQNKTVYENVAFAMEMIGKSDADIRDDVPHSLELVGLDSKGFHFPDELSGGEQQRLAIARAIINQPELLIADEPTDSLDPENTNAVVNILKKIHELGTTVVLATHNTAIVDALEERVIEIRDGRIIRDEKHGRYHRSDK